MLHKMGDGVGLMGICGTGGIGKTALAREVNNQEQSSFKNHCFLKDVNECKGVAIMDLQMRMVTDLLHVESKNLPTDPKRWFEMIRKQKVFLVVDDISERKQFYELIPDLKQLAPGSRLLITSQDSDILHSIMLDVPELQRALYYVPHLNSSDSLELFIWCAFQKKTLDEVDAFFHEYVERITRACGGVPLALEVMGRYLGHKRSVPECWTEATSALRKNGDIMTSLQISYDGLGNDDKKRMFVDIACFMLGHPEDVVLEIWNSVDYDSLSWSLSRLIDKCLVKVDDEGLLSMHDLLRDMGRNVVMEKAREKCGLQSHIWDPSEGGKILQKTQDSKEVLALSLIGVASSKAAKAELYARMSELRYLLLDGCLVNGDFSGRSEESRWLQWRYFPHEELPQSLKLPNLVVLDLAHSLHLTCIWTRNFEIEFHLEALRMLILSNCRKLEYLPQYINNLVKLKFLVLRSCSSLSSLPDSLGDVTELEELKLSGCTLLQTLTPIVCKFKKLRVFHMQETALTRLLEDFGQLCSLKEVKFTSCKRVLQLPESFGNLCNLEELWMGGCTKLQSLGESFGSLGILRNLVLKGCASLSKLPESFGNLTNLEELWMGGCTKLQSLWEGFGSLGILQQLDLEGCASLSQLPESFGNLSNLEELTLKGCGLLDNLPPSFCRLAKLKVLVLEDTALEELLEEFGQLHSLREVYFSYSKCLRRLPKSFWNLSNLEVLHLDGCELLQNLPPSICALKKLKEICLNCMTLDDLPEEFGQLQSLTQADFEDCNLLRSLCESFVCLGNLQKLNLRGCSSLIRLPESFSNLTNLENLDLRGCRLLQAYPQSNERRFVQFDVDNGI